MPPPQWQLNRGVSSKESVSGLPGSSTWVRNPPPALGSDCQGGSLGGGSVPQPGCVPSHVASASSSGVDSRAPPSSSEAREDPKSVARPRMSLNDRPARHQWGFPGASCDAGSSNGHPRSASPLDCETASGDGNPRRRTMGGNGLGERVPFQDMPPFTPRVQNGDESKAGCATAAAGSDRPQDAWTAGPQEERQQGSRDPPHVLGAEGASFFGAFDPPEARPDRGGPQPTSVWGDSPSPPSSSVSSLASPTQRSGSTAPLSHRLGANAAASTGQGEQTQGRQGRKRRCMLSLSRNPSESGGALSAEPPTGGWPPEERPKRSATSETWGGSVAGNQPFASGALRGRLVSQGAEWRLADPAFPSPCAPLACPASPSAGQELAVHWQAFRHPARSRQEERARTILRVQEEQRQVLLEIQQQREEARQRGEELPDEPPPELACKMCGVDDSGNLLHPGCVDMGEFLASLGGLYDVGLDQEEEKNVQEEIQSLQERLQQLLVKMGRSSGRGEGGGGPVSQKEPARVPEVVFRNILEKEIKSFQDLVIDEHKEKKKLFRQLAGGCRRHVEAVEKKKQMKAEEEERRLRAVAKSTCGPVEVFWQRIERLVWEREKRQLQRQLHEKKKQRLDRLVNEAMQQCRRLAQGLRKPCASGDQPRPAQLDGGKRLTSETTMSSRRNSIFSEEEAKERGKGSRRNAGHQTCGRDWTKREARDEGRLTEEAGVDEDEQEWTASKFAKDQEEEDDRLEAEMERGEGEEQEDIESELRGLQDEADMPVEELLKRIYGVEGGQTQLASDRRKEQKEKARRKDEEEEGEDEGDEEDGEEEDREDEDEEGEENQWSMLVCSKEQEEEDERLDDEMEKEDDEQEDPEAELRGLQDEANMPVDELLKRIYCVAGGEAQLAADRRREADNQVRREKTVREETEDRKEERHAEGEEGGQQPHAIEERAARSEGEAAGDRLRGNDDSADDDRSEFSLDGGCFGKQEEEDEELDAAMKDEDDEEEDELKRLQEDAEMPIDELIRRFGAPSSGPRPCREETSSDEEEVVVPVHRSVRPRRSRGDSRCQLEESSEASPCRSPRCLSPGQAGEESEAVKREEGAAEDPPGGEMREETKAGDASPSQDMRADLLKQEGSEKARNVHLGGSPGSPASVYEGKHVSPTGDSLRSVKSVKSEEGGYVKRLSPLRPSHAEAAAPRSSHHAGAPAVAKKQERTHASLPSEPSGGQDVDDLPGPSPKEESDAEGLPAASPGASSLPSNPAPALVRATLRTYQSEGVQWLFALHDKGLNGILADEMGLGKTLQTIVLLARLALERGVWGPHLIVVPTSVMLNWEREFFKFCPGFKVLVYFGSAQERAKKRTGWSRPYAFHVCIASYSTVVKDAQIFKRKKWYSLVLDEAQNIKNFHSRRWQTLLTFNTQHRLLLTGTPLQNNLAELWSLMHFLMPTVFQSHEDFKEWFGDPLTAAIEQEQVSEHQQLLEKLHALLRPYLLRRLKKDVEKQMPRKYEHVVRCSLTKRQKCLYDEFMQRRQVQQTMAAGNYRGMMNILMQLRKVCNHPDLFEPRPIETPVGGGGVNALSYDIPAMVCLWLYEPWNWSIEERFRRVTLPIVSLIHYEMRFSSLQHGLAQNWSPLRLLCPSSSSPRLQSSSPFDLLAVATPVEGCDLLSLPQPIYTRRLHASQKGNASLCGPPCSASCSASERAAVADLTALSPRVSVEKQGTASSLWPPPRDQTDPELVLTCHSPVPYSQVSSLVRMSEYPVEAGPCRASPPVSSGEAGRPGGTRPRDSPAPLATVAVPIVSTVSSGLLQGPPFRGRSPSPVQSSAPPFSVAPPAPLSWLPVAGSVDSHGQPVDALSPNSVLQSPPSPACRASARSFSAALPLRGPTPAQARTEGEACLPAGVRPRAGDREDASGASLGFRGACESTGCLGHTENQRQSPDISRTSPLTPVDTCSGPDCEGQGEGGHIEGIAVDEPRLFSASGVHASSPARVSFQSCGSQRPMPSFANSEETGEISGRGAQPPSSPNGVPGFPGVLPRLRASDESAPAVAGSSSLSSSRLSPFRPVSESGQGDAGTFEAAQLPPPQDSEPVSSAPAFPGRLACVGDPNVEKEKALVAGGTSTSLRASARAAARRSREEGRATNEESLPKEHDRHHLAKAPAVPSTQSSVLPSLSSTKRRRLLRAAMSPTPGGKKGPGAESVVPSLGSLVEVPLLRNTSDTSNAQVTPHSASASSALPVSLVLTQPFGCASIPDLDGFLAAHARRRCWGRDRRRLVRNCFPVPPAFVSHLLHQQEDSEKDGKVVEDQDMVLKSGEVEAGALSAGRADSLGSRAGAGGSSGGICSPATLDRGKPRRQMPRGIKRAGTLWRRWVSSERCEMQPGLCLVDATGGESLLDSLTPPSESEYRDGAGGEDRGAQKADFPTTLLARPGEPFSAAVDANEGTRMRKAEFWRSEEMRCQASQAVFLFNSCLSLASPPPFGGRDTRELLRKEISQSPLNPIGSVHEPVRICEDFLARTETLRRITPTPTEVFDRDQTVILRCSVLCNPRVQPGAPRIFLRGPGGIQARENSFSAFAESLDFLQGSAAELHEAVERQRRIFPHKQTLQDDCGKLIILAELLTKLRADGHRCLLFTQFSKMLDVLESWINHQGFTYVRLDGSTKVDQRQRVVTRFNASPRIFLFISSTRAGGVGLNLTGADTVIFYDTDWNPAMDRQAMDRCHRIGQTRDVHVYRLVTEHSIEENIWRKQLQKRLLDEVVVDRGLFTMENTTREGHLGQQTQDKDAAREWFANAETLKDLLASPEDSIAKSGFKGDIYADRILHDSGEDHPDDAESVAPVARSGKKGEALGRGGEFEAAILEVEDVEDVAAMQQTTREEKQAKQEMQQDFRGEKIGDEGAVDLNGALERMPALAAYCVRLINENKPPSLLAQIAQLKIQVRAEGNEDEAKQSEEDRQSESEEPSESSDGDGPALWESEIESEETDEE
ncbi:putative SNF2 family N-terminal domain-containing protein [Neospora caninum Liverpool]|uniref:Putative SNF2 family N-terminal domain-containing protein n=1 Tax=Neospora caninum (strain Liverpool) TaxID=572307 RepID=F0VEK6_NEOCL|nr:putative SNF2 family N-terminal domain-containing protein [Neospora caninum Liverpool]CBZ52150.1 putative SNF2 family N-terminal domain-containing protein [Neospora caninum Liverpool]CEL66114.1 TPA: SNF2 family N-terminal domain-containing protein,putative [Neospora caninum Liverpool]|eukprot:XP_003882182.1 putative SNF2 family N-terminal domain-containing protein [Neospora caninum Liverpool]